MSHTEGNAFMWFSTGITAIVFGFPNSFELIPCGIKSFCVVYMEFLWPEKYQMGLNVNNLSLS